MILKKLEIQGFKSFADRTEVLFTPGVTAVVGPNGSGKSNISDAILWVLGEQNVRTLRGQKAQDVIFAGTDKRRPIGMAEVSLTVDNSSGRLPLNYSEVTITRRAYRSGESEFFINKIACRLKDIYELFMDTGVGREAYSIVSQGEMDAILSARPEDRRGLFDEAAGIKKYRHRKKEAERKLDSVQGNLNRVNDIIVELQDQVEPMAEQARIAERYLELTSRLREIEVGILVNDLRRFTDDLERVREEKDAA
ncbi:MAG TPA: AAA family ATPase, partial [Armatimonadota bacterium]